MECDDLMSYWNSRKTSFPKLYTVYSYLASIPGTSAASERSFSEANVIISSKRTMIDPKKVNMLLVLNSHLKIINHKLEKTNEILQNN